MTVVLMILKVIGILLLAVLGILLAALLLVLFVPFRYSVQGEYREKLSVGARVSWLLRLLTVRVSYDKTLEWSVRAAGIRILSGPGGGKPKKKSAKDKNGQASDSASGDETEVDAPDPAGSVPSEVGGAGSLTDGKDDSAKDWPTAEKGSAADTDACAPEKDKTSAVKANASASETDGTSAAETDASASEKDGKSAAEADTSSEEDAPSREAGKSEEAPENTAEGIADRIGNLFQRLEDRLQDAEKKLETLSDTVSRYIDLLDREDTRIALSTVFTQVFRILRHIMPRRLRADFIVGTGNPAADGQIAAWQGMLYPFLHDSVLVLPDFEKKRIEGTFSTEGRITVCRLLICGLAVIRRKEVRQLIRRLRNKEEKKDGRKS